MLDAEPPLVVTAILPVVAPVGTVAVICLSEFTTNVADVPLKVTFVAWVSPVPVMVTEVPTGPLGGVKLANVGFTLNVCGLVRVVLPVVTVTGPVRAAAGTVAVRYVEPESVFVVAVTPPNFTTEALVKPCPNMPTFAPSFSASCVGSRFTNGASPVLTLKKAPWQGGEQVLGPPAEVVPYTSPFVF